MKDNKLKLLVKKLNSDKNEEVVFTIKQLRNTGNAKILPHLFDILLTNKSEKVRAEAVKLLNDLKDASCQQEIVSALKQEKYKSLHKDILISCWNSSLDYSEYAEVFVDIFKKSNFELAFEAFTVIDNFEKKLNSSVVSNIVSDLKNDISNYKGTDKEHLYVELVHIFNSKK